MTNVASVVLLVVAALALGTLGGLLRRPLTRLAGRVVHPRTRTPTPPPAHTAAEPAAGRNRRAARRAEPHLASRLLAGDLNASDYRDAMAALPAEEARRHPMVVPGDE